MNSPTQPVIQETKSTEKNLPGRGADRQTEPVSGRLQGKADLIRQTCLEEGADDAGFVDIGRPALVEEKDHILHVYPRTRTIISIVQIMNRENIQSPARYVANNDFHHTIDELTQAARRILSRLNALGIRGVVPTVGFPMDMDRWQKDLRIWDVSHKPIAVQAGLGRMGKNRNVIHPKFGNFILLESILIDTELDGYGEPLDYNPCFTCNLCVTACPVGAISKDWQFDFSACLNHNYREFMGGFQDWVEGAVSSKNVKEYRSRFTDSETVSMWQSLSFGANYKAAYCMAVCPAGEDVMPGFISNKKEYVQEVLKPLRDKVEPVYVRPDSHAENFARENPNKTIRYIQTPIRPASISGFLRGIQLTFNRDKAKGFHCTLHFEFTGKEKETATIHIADEKIRVEKGIQGQADVRVKTDTQTWLNIVNGEASEVWAVITGKLNVKGPLKLLQRFKDCVKP